MWPFTRQPDEQTSAIRDLASAVRNNTGELHVNGGALRQNSVTNAVLERQLKKTNQLLADLIRRLSNIPDPGPLSLNIISEIENVLTFSIGLPSAPAEKNDIVSGALTVTIGSAEPQKIETTKDQTAVEGLKGEQGDLVLASFVWLDDATPPNPSTNPAVLSVVLSDTIPPADPGSLSLTVTGEE